MPFTRFHFPAPALLSVVVLFLVGANATQAQTAVPYEEFVGPFSSWRQVQCSGSDDTAMLQNELNKLGKPGNSPVLYIKPSTCRITSTLTLQGRENVTFLGADPATTKVVWAGAAGGTMFHINGVGHSRFGRITWDHGNIPGDAIDSIPDSSAGNFFPTDNRHEDEIITGMVVGPTGEMNIGAKVGVPGGLGDAETTWIREQFTDAQAGLFFGNDNVLDHWVWDSLFQNNRYAVTNVIDSATDGSGAGGYTVNRSVFLNNAADLAMGSANFMSERWNYSRGARWRHLDLAPIGSPSNPITIQGVQVYGAGDPSSNEPIQMGSPGPLTILDSTMLSTRPVSSTPQADILSVGNKFSSTSPYPVSSGTRLHQVDDRSGVAISDPGPPTLPSTPQNMNRPVFEPATKDSAGVQAAINQAAASTTRAIVHLPYGNYDLSSTVTIPANATLQLVGDGLGATAIGGAATPLIRLNGPTQAVLRDFSLAGSGSSAQGIVVNNANQPNGLVHLEELVGGHHQVGLLLNGLNQTMVDSFDSQINSTSAADYRATAGSTLRIFNGAGCCSTGSVYDVQGGSTIVAQNMYFENGGPAQLVAANGNGTVVADSGKITGKAGTAANVSTFTGTSVLQNLVTVDNTPVVGGTNSLLFGNTSSPAPTDASATFLNWGPRLDAGGGATSPVPETSAGVSDARGYVRQHEAALRAAVPQPLTARGIGLTDLRVYRVGGDNFSTLFTITGTPAQATAAAASPTPMSPATPATSGPATATPIASATGTTSGATPLVPSVTSQIAIHDDYAGRVAAQSIVRGAP